MRAIDRHEDSIIAVIDGASLEAIAKRDRLPVERLRHLVHGWCAVAGIDPTRWTGATTKQASYKLCGQCHALGPNPACTIPGCEAVAAYNAQRNEEASR